METLYMIIGLFILYVVCLVIERYQTENGSGGRSSGIHSASASPSPSERSSPRSMNSRHIRDITPPLREEDVSDWEEGEATDEALELPRRVPFPEFGGDIIHHTNNEDRDFDEVSGSDIQAVDGTWEENWLFQRKKIKTIQSVPVPMLVPNSNTEYRALIGDRDADDTTDLSDNASDADEDDVEYQSNIKKVLNSKHVIGGKTKIDDIVDFEPDSLTIVDGTNDFEKINEHEYLQNKVVDAVNNEVNDNEIVKVEDIINDDISKEEKDSVLLIDIDSGPLPKAEFALKEEIHRSVLNGGTETHTEDLNKKTNEEVYKDIMDKLPNNKECTSTLPSRHEREKEYEETVTMPVQRYADSLRRKHFEEEPQQIPTRDTDKDDELIPGTIAYRERKKWLNCVEMPNNPYSPEAIKKRLSAKNTSSLFDMITSTNDLDEKSKISEDIVDAKDSLDNTQSIKEINHKKSSLYLNTENIAMNGKKSPSPSPKILQEILSEEVPQYKRYGRDYYIKEAKASSGGRKKNSFSDTSSTSSMNKSTSVDSFDREFSSPGLLIKQFNNIASNQQYTKFAANEQTQDSITTMPGTNNNQILIEYEDANEQTLFSNKPTYADSDTDQKFEEILKSAYENDAPNVEVDRPIEEPPKSPNNASIDNSYVSSSSMEDSLKIYKYNVQTGEIVKSKPDDNVSPRYEPLVDKNDNIDIPDKNVLGENVDIISQNGDVLEEAVIIEEVGEENLDTSEVDEDMPHYPNVRELAKIFVSMENLAEQKTVKPPQQLTKRQKSKENLFDPTNKTEKFGNKQAYMHSLTARSISKEFREELKLSMATPLKVPGGSKEIPEGIEDVIKESGSPGSPLPEPGTIKTKLAFFESLKSKFSTK